MSATHLRERKPVLSRWLIILLLATVFAATEYMISGQAQAIKGLMPSDVPTLTMSATPGCLTKARIELSPDLR